MSGGCRERRQSSWALGRRARKVLCLAPWRRPWWRAWGAQQPGVGLGGCSWGIRAVGCGGDTKRPVEWGGWVLVVGRRRPRRRLWRGNGGWCAPCHLGMALQMLRLRLLFKLMLVKEFLVLRNDRLQIAERFNAGRSGRRGRMDMIHFHRTSPAAPQLFLRKRLSFH